MSFWKPASVFDYVCTEILLLLLAKYSSFLTMTYLACRDSVGDLQWCKFEAYSVI